jgi:hypothetical protein
MHRDAHRCFIHNCQNLEATTMPFGRWSVQTVGYETELKRNDIKSWKEMMHISNWRKSNPKSLQPYDILEKVRLKTVKRSVTARGSWEGGREGGVGTQRTIRAVNWLCDGTVEMCHYKSVQTHRMHSTHCEP